ncbi:hypothetical protein GCM10009830_46440 [Glycomyces endophyticus]|uniref:Uncharacterized protein n=1 Tax=Glycomyces endophyticus TaxID=480996 RepID=A0ABP4TTM1_9ACTN
MDKEPPEPARTDPPITVESAAPEPTESDPRTAACPHRLRWTDLAGFARYSIIRRTASAAAALAVAIGALTKGLEGLDGIRAGADADSLFLAATTALLIPTALALAVGPIEYLRTLRRPHRPSRTAHVLHATGLILLASAVFTAIEDRELLIFALVPGFLVMQELARLRAALTDRATCATDPALPIKLRAYRKDAPAWPTTDEERRHHLGPRIVQGEFDSWECPHWAPLSALRPWAKAESVLVLNSLYLYALGAIATGTAVAYNLDRFPIDLPHGSIATLVVGVLLAYLNYIAYQTAFLATHMHRLSVSRYLLPFATFALTGALAAWAAAALDRPYLWAVVPLALFNIYGIVSDLVLYKPITHCRSRPELHPRVLSRLKA